jgi:uncharacterized protein (DUF433 family)
MAISSLALTPAEAAALLDLPERQVRKEAEHGLFGTASPPRLSFLALVYFQALRWMDLELGVNDRKKLLAKIRAVMDAGDEPEMVELTHVLSLRLGSVVRDVAGKVEAFTRWKEKLEAKPNILGGEPVFPGSRLAVRHVGGLVERGEPVTAILKDYPYLTVQDVEFAKLYTRAYPQVGRPREPDQAPPR